MYSVHTKSLLSLLLTSFLFSCDPKKEELEVEDPEDYAIPLQPGKYITYRLDSLVFVQAGRSEETHSYQEKHVVDASFTDNTGQKSYRIYRYLNNLAGTQSWAPAGTYIITPTLGTLEVIENNMRVIALAGPVKEGQSWKGNRFIGPEPYASLHNFSNDDNIGDWDFEIESTSETITLNNRSVKNVITVTHINEILNVPITDPTAFASKSLSVDKFAKGIGLVYQEHVLWEYQPNPNGTPYKTGFGIKRSLLEHN